MKTLTLFTGFLLPALMHLTQLQAATSDPSYNDQYSYIENKGQIVDQNGSPRKDVRFLYFDNGFKLVLRNTGFSYEFTKEVLDNPNDAESGQLRQTIADEEDVVIPDFHYVASRVDVELKNCNSNAEIITEGASPFYKNYFNGYTGPAGVTFIHSFTKVTYKNIYEGIDLVFSTKRQADGKIFPEYEFIVNPSGNMNAILLSYSGAEQMSFASNGDLKLNGELGYVNESRPVILCPGTNSSMQGSFILEGNMLSFKNVKREKDQTIIIDPTIAWGTYYGGNKKDIPDELGTDTQSNIYLTGRTGSSTMIATAGAQKTTYGGGDDALIVKFDKNGNLIWATYHGGSGNDVAFDITCDGFDNIFIGGRTVSKTGIATPGAVIDTVSGGLFDVFIAKFNSAGVLQWGTYMGGNLKDEVQGLACDADGDLYVSGYTESLYGISTPGTYKSVGDTAGESFLMKFDPVGHQLWGTYYGGKKRDRGHGVWASNGHVYQVGTTNSKNGIATPGSYQSAYTKGLDAFLAEWTEDGQLVWATYVGGEGDDRPRDVRTDDAGNLYFAGQTESETGIATPGTWKSTLQYQPNNNRDGFIEKFTPSGFRIWGTYFGGNWIEMPRSLRIGRTGAPIWLGGYTKSDSGLASPGAYNRKLGGGNDGFLAKLDWNASQLMYATYYGGKKSESITEGGWYGSPMEMDREGNIYLASCTQSPDSIATPNGYKTFITDTTGQYDFFIVKFNDGCSDPYEPNDTVTVTPEIPFNQATNAFTINGQIAKKNDKDYFIVNIRPGMQNFKVDLTNLPIDCNLFVYDTSQVLVDKSQTTGLVNESVVVNGAYAGKYYILVKAPYPFPFDPSNCYTLTVSASDTSFKLFAPQETAADNNFVMLYPNPATDASVLVVTCKTQANCQVEIRDLTGRKLQAFTKSVAAGENDIDLPLNKLANGEYMVRVTINGVQQTVKLTVQK